MKNKILGILGCCLLLNSLSFSACGTAANSINETVAESDYSSIPITDSRSNPTSINREGIEMPEFTKESNILTAEAAKEINENSNFGNYFLLYPFNKEEFPTLKHGETFPVMEGTAEGMFDYYPFSEGRYLLAYIGIKASPCYLLDVHIGDEISTVADIMETYGFKELEYQDKVNPSEKGYITYRYYKYDVYLYFCTPVNSNKINFMSVGIDDPDRPMFVD